jgi:hypothetical protein
MFCCFYEVEDKMAVDLMAKYMTKKVSQFFMRHVASSRKKWHKKQVYEGLFYCFPAHFKLEPCEKMWTAVQSSQSVRDFAQELEAVAIRFPDISERNVRQIFWRGIRVKLRSHLAAM